VLVLAGLGLSGRMRCMLELALIPLAAAALLVAHYVNYDPYDAPIQRRYSEGSIVPTSGVVTVGCLATIVAGALPPAIAFPTVASGLRHPPGLPGESG
jgi:hypothetical protein